MIRRLNFTDRKRLKREDLEISLGRSPRGGIEFDAVLNLDSYELPPEANVFVEAYRRTTVMRFPVGTVAEFKLPQSRELDDFGRPEGILFRVKVTSDAPDRGKLLAEADRIGFRQPEDTAEEQVPLMPVEAGDIGALVWKIEFTDGPVLMVSEKLGDWREVVRSEAFLTLVLPEALRQVLTRIWIVEKSADDDDDDLDTWQFRWNRFIQQLPGLGASPDIDSEQTAVEAWIEDVVKAFSKQLDLLNRFLCFWTQEEGRK